MAGETTKLQNGDLEDGGGNGDGDLGIRDEDAEEAEAEAEAEKAKAMTKVKAEKEEDSGSLFGQDGDLAGGGGRRVSAVQAQYCGGFKRSPVCAII